MRELLWMVHGRRRDEWDRHALLLTLIDNRTNFAKGATPVKPLDYIPADLITRDDLDAIERARKARVIPITAADLQALVGGAKHGRK